MATSASPVLVTGGSGFLALELVAQLLAAGYTVHATVRSLANAAKVAPLRALQDAKDSSGEARLVLFEADLLAEGSFDAAMRGCAAVFHVASPFLMAEKIRDGQAECVEPAVRGTRNVLDAANRTPSVLRVVLTSTVGAIFGDYADVKAMEGGILSEKYWNETSSVKHNPYHYSKVCAERLAWEVAGKQQRWDLVVVCPGLILGPSRTGASVSGSLFLLDEMLRGDLWFGVPDLAFDLVDVRDVALAHVRAAEKADVQGRYIVAMAEMVSFLEVARMVREAGHGRKWLLPRWTLPNAIVRVVGPLFGLSQRWMKLNLGERFAIDNSRSIRELGIIYRPVEETIKDHYISWEAQQKGGKQA